MRYAPCLPAENVYCRRALCEHLKMANFFMGATESQYLSLTPNTTQRKANHLYSLWPEED
jgi:hypothetical protein